MKKILLYALLIFSITAQANCSTIEQAIMSADISMLTQALESQGGMTQQDVSRFIALSDEMIVFWRNQIELYQLKATPSLKLMAGFLGIVGFGGFLFASYMDNCFNRYNLGFNAKLSAGLLASLYLVYKGLTEPDKTMETLLTNYMNAMGIKQIFLGCFKPT